MYTGPLGGSHWEAREDASREVLVALYLRDALGVVDPSGLPRLLGTGLPAIETADDHTTYWWMRWWVSIVEPNARGWGTPLQMVDDEGLVVLPETGAESYIAAIRRHLDSARAWADVAHQQYAESMPHRQHLTVTETVREREAELGRAANPFRLRIEVLPLTTAGLWWIGENAIAVDELLRDEPMMYADALRPIIAQLA